MEAQKTTLKPVKPIHIEFYQFDHKSEAKWEIRQCGSIANNAAYFWSRPTEAEANEDARAFVDDQRGKGFDLRLAEWEYHTQRYYQIYPEYAEDAALLKMLKTLEGKEFKLIEPYLSLPRVCDGCHCIRLEIAKTSVYEYDDKDQGHKRLLLCPPCFKGYIEAETVWGPPHYARYRFNIKRDAY